jgi:hypothetical protein
MLARGMDCAESLTDKTEHIELMEAIAFLEPTAERGGAICRSVEDEVKIKTVLERLCRELGSGCSYEVIKTIESLGQVLR